ncbi:helix-turn-helix domain-containing protein [uncultured Oscillibacter sp.]|jgi:two-component system response regulator YesN|uniref:helix-turn-helix domain-containing protein n=1 Tax=uncultured Oscillibacter sp. TaxID=876091 RepID=UPI0025D9D811|nr:helix-turn-helix domain-containing protein [uncultured Oscillibacter sp.]
MEEYRVLLADDEEEIRSGISRKIDWASLGLTLVGEAGNGEEALELAEQLRPDVVLTDIKMPFLDGLELCRRLRVTLPGARLVVFSGFDDFEYARQAMSLGVSEYILKPINAPELRQVLEKLRDQLDRQRLERRDMETLRRRYEESLPVLRELFYTRLLSGQIRPEQVQDRAARYEIDLPQGLWTAALVHVDGLGDEGERDELLLLSVQSFLEKHFALEGCAARVVLYGDMAALLVHLDREERLYPLLEELERLSRLSQSYLGLRLTTGVGLPCRGPEELNRSAAGARSALDYRVLAGGGRVIYIGDLEPQSAAAPSFEEEDQRALSAAVKLGTQEQAEAVVRGLMDRLRHAGLSLSKCDLFLLEVVTCLVRLTRSGGLPVEEVFGENFTGAVSVSDFSSLEELGRWLAERCGRLHDLLGRRRSDSTWQMVERAKDYIAGHYTDEQLSVEALCSHIHLSPTYFSTVFKREVGMSFTAYVTKVRMEEAARLLRETDEKTYRIAEAAGFSDPNYFSYVFKRHFGLSPSKFRAALFLKEKGAKEL